MNRRRFLQNTGAALFGGVITPAALSPDPAFVAFTQGAKVPRITAVIFDERYRDCEIFADALVARGAKPFAVNGNSAALWYGPLRIHLNSAPGPIAGLTSESDRGVSLASGRELHLKLLYEGSHDARRSASIGHRIRVTADEDGIAAALRRPRAPWSASLAHALDFAPSPSAPITASLLACENQRPVVATTPLSPDFPGYLASWLLAPLESS
jgi:hypothetical protein